MVVGNNEVIFTRNFDSITPLSMEEIARLFPDVTREQSRAGLTDYASVYIRNLSDEALPATLDIEVPTPSDDSLIEIGLGNNRDDVDFVRIGQLVGSTLPTSVTFGAVTTSSIFQATGFAIEGDIIYASPETASAGIRRFNRNTLAQIGSSYPLNSDNSDPRSIAVDDQFIYMGDSDDGLYIYNKTDGSFVRKQTLPAVFTNPNGMYVDDENLYIGENAASRRLIVVNKTTFQVVSTHSLPSSTNNISGVAIHNGLVFVSNWTDRVIRVYSRDFSTLITTSPNLGFNPNGFTIDDDKLYVTQWSSTNFHVYPVTYTGSVPTPGLPISLGNFEGTVRLWIKRIIAAGAEQYTNDMPTILLKEVE